MFRLHCDLNAELIETEQIKIDFSQLIRIKKTNLVSTIQHSFFFTYAGLEPAFFLTGFRDDLSFVFNIAHLHQQHYRHHPDDDDYQGGNRCIFKYRQRGLFVDQCGKCIKIKRAQ